MSRQIKFGFIIYLLCLTIFAALYFTGCATAPVKREKTPEEIQAYKDSVNLIHKRKLQLKWSLGYEPFKQEDYPRAKKYFLQVAKLDTTGEFTKSLYQRLGYCYEHMSMEDSAMWAYELGVERLPKDTYLWGRIAEINIQKGDNDRAISIFENKLTKIDTANIDHWKKLGNLYIKTKDQDLARGAYEKAAEIDPDDKETQEILTTLVDSPEEIIQIQLNMIATNPDNFKARKKAAKYQIETGEYKDAIDQLNYVLAKTPNDLTALEFLGKAQSESGKNNKAIATYKKIILINSDDKRTYCNLSMTYTAIGRYTTALSHVRKALKIDPKYGLAYIAKGMAYETCADKCREAREDKKMTFDDKLVYQLAYDAYSRAKKDFEWRGDAENRSTYLQPYIPTQADEFMHKGHDTPRSDCYNWI